MAELSDPYPAPPPADRGDPQPTPGSDRYLDADMIARELGVHVQTVQGYFRTGGLPGRKIGHSWRTTRDAFDRWLTSGPIPTNGPHDAAGPHIDVPVGTSLPPLETKDQP